MFDSVLSGGSARQSRFGAGAIMSILIHLGLVALVIFLSRRPAEEKRREAEVKFFAAIPVAAPAPPAAAPPARAKPQTPRSEKKKLKQPDQLIPPKEIPQDKPKEAEPDLEPQSAPEEPAGKEGGEEGGSEGGVKGGLKGATGAGAPTGATGGLGPDVLAFGEGMSRPVADPANRPPQFTREALEARIEGVMLVKCTITLRGELENCRVLKPLPHMERAVLDALSKWKFAPVTFQGRPVTVDYVIPVRLVMPRAR